MSAIRPAAYDSFRTWLRGRTGMTLGQADRALVGDRLASIVDERGSSLSMVLAEVTRDQRLAEEVIDAMTTGETSWFRDGHPFEALRTSIVPEMLGRNAEVETLSVLSAGCSTGQEAYSVAMLLRTHFPQLTTWQVRIDGYDVSRAAVARAREGRYRQDEVDRGLPPTMLRWLRRDGDDLVVDDELRRWTSFRRMNLLDHWGPSGPYDVALLRNVLGRFDDDSKQSLLRQLVAVTRPGGVVVLGAGETVDGLDVPLTPRTVGRTTVFRTPSARRSPRPAPVLTTTAP